MKCLIVYYSLDENTSAAAERIAEKTGFDAVRIESVKRLPRSTFLKLIVGGGQVTAGKRPELEILPIDPDLYDVIILGTPVWADKCAAPVYSFISSIKDHSRIKAVFTLSAGGDNEKCLKQLEKLNADILASVSLYDRRSKNASLNDARIDEFSSKLAELFPCDREE